MTLLRDRCPVRAVDHPSGTYDRPTALSLGHSRGLLCSARRLRLPDDGAATHTLDLGCGTGASPWALLTAAPRARTTVVDASAGMLSRAPAKPWPARVRFLRMTAEVVAAARNRPFDTVPAFVSRLTAAGSTGVRATPVAGRQTGVVHTFLARTWHDTAPAAGCTR
ncbi:class I SAM-dependent methyltransferase [Streptomyces sp. MAR4 CNY-716]